LASAKDLIVKPIKAAEANALVKRVHYSGKVVQNSQLHFGVYIGGRLEGAMQFGPSLDKRKLLSIVEGTQWNGFVELNRMAFSEALPRNSESRALGVAMRMLRKHAPHLEWVVSFADATQCGDGTIYRAAGFVLTSVKINAQNYLLPHSGMLDTKPLLAAGCLPSDIETLCAWLDEITPHKMSLQGAPHAHKMSLEGAPHAHKMSLQGAPHAHKMSLQGGCRPSHLLSKVKIIMRKMTGGGTSADTLFRLMGGKPHPGYQLRYLYFLNPDARQRLTVPILPFAEIDRRGAGMYRGKPRAGSAVGGTSANHAGGGGSTPTPALSISGASTDQITEG
jgi:hypothetical protein